MRPSTDGGCDHFDCRRYQRCIYVEDRRPAADPHQVVLTRFDEDDTDLLARAMSDSLGGDYDERPSMWRAFAYAAIEQMLFSRRTIR